MVLGVEEGLDLRFLWMGGDWSMRQSLNTWCVLDESGTEGAECRRKIVSGKKVVVVRVNFKSMSLECARVPHEVMLVPVLLYGKEGEGEVCY